MRAFSLPSFGLQVLVSWKTSCVLSGEDMLCGMLGLLKESG